MKLHCLLSGQLRPIKEVTKQIITSSYNSILPLYEESSEFIIGQSNREYVAREQRALFCHMQ